MVYCRKAKKQKYSPSVHSFTKTSMIESLNPADHFNSFERGHAFDTSLLQKQGIDRSIQRLRTEIDSVENDDEQDDYNWDYEVDCSDDNDELDESDPDEDYDHHDVNFNAEFYEQSSTSTSYNELRQKYDRLKHTLPPDQDADTTSSSGVVNDLSNFIPTTTQCFINLLKILKRHRVDKMLFDELVEWAFHWYENDHYIFHHNSKKWTRTSLIDHLSKRFQKSNLRPTNVNVQLSDGRLVTVPVIDFKACIFDILDDPQLNTQSNLMEGLDYKTWRPQSDDDDTDEDYIIGDKVTGYLYKDGIDLHCPSSLDGIDEKIIRPLPLIFHIDKSHSDISGNLAVTPVTVTLGMFNVDVQQETTAWRNCSCIPNLSAKKGRSSRSSAPDKAVNSAQDYHLVLAASFSSFRHYYEQGGFTWINQEGDKIILKPFILLIIGDTLGNNELCGHYNNWNSNCPLKDCKCVISDLISTPTRCGYILKEDLEDKIYEEVFDLFTSKNLVSLRDYFDLKENKLLEKVLSIHSIDNAFFDLPLADAYQGIVGVTPQELLHVLESGILGYILLSFRDIIGVRDTNSKMKKEVDSMFSDIKSSLDRNSERDYYRMANRKGFLDLKMLSGTERHGNFLGMVLLLHTTYAHNLLEDRFASAGLSLVESRKTCMVLLGWSQFAMDLNTCLDVKNAITATQHLQETIKNTFPREVKEKTVKEPGSMGWHIPKFHCMPRLISNTLKFGCAKVFHGSAGEKNHKVFAKDSGKNTQRRIDSYASQVAWNNFEFAVIDVAYRHISDNCPKEGNLIHEYKGTTTTRERQYYTDVQTSLATTDQEIRKWGEYTLHLSVDSRGRIHGNCTWMDERKNKLMCFRPNELMQYAITENAMKYRQQQRINIQSSELKLKIRGFTELKKNDVLFRASSNFQGNSWYDWALVSFPPTVTSVGNETCAAQILGIFQYMEASAMTFKKMEMDGLSGDDCLANVDNTLYVALRCQMGYMNYSHLERNMIRRFSMMEGVDKLYILPASRIVGPLLVVPDIEDNKTLSSINYIACCARTKWGNYFKHYMKNEISGENDSDIDEDDVNDWGIDE